MYFEYEIDLTPGALARSEQIDQNFEAIEVAFQAAEGDVFQTIRLTDVAAPAEADYQIATPAAQRAGKLLGFDPVTGLPKVVSDFGSWEGAWTTATSYLEKAIVSGPDSHFNSIYIALSDHTSSDFATDLAAGKWALMIDLTQVKRSIITHTVIDAADSPYALSKGEDVMIDVSGGAVTVVLPAAPLITDQPINLLLIGDPATNVVTIDRNGKPIMGLAEDMTVEDVPNASFGLAFSDDTFGWRVRGV